MFIVCFVLFLCLKGTYLILLQAQLLGRGEGTIILMCRVFGECYPSYSKLRLVTPYNLHI